MRRTGMILIAAAAICTLAACGGTGTERETETSVETESSQPPQNEDTQSAESSTAEPEATESSTAEPEAAESSTAELENAGAETADQETETTASPDQETDVDVETEPFTPVAGLSENYADLENRSFAYNGQIFTLGESTLQDLIDGGIPFDEEELNNAGNNVNSNYETSRYSVYINDYVYIQFSFINTTESNISEAECVLHLVRLSSIYVPQPDYEDSLNEKITELINDAGKTVCFSFPLTLTKEQLLDNNDKATEISDTNYVRYSVDSEVYMGDSGYNFQFDRKTNQLKEVTISWLP